MEDVNTEWLPHLAKEIVSETQGNYLDAYVVSLEGWRRGLKLRWHVKDSEKFKEMKTWYVDKPGQLFSLSSDVKTHYFFRTRGDKVTNDAVTKGMNKETTKQLLEQANVLVPEGKQFIQEATNEDIVNYAEKLGFPVVIKPTDGSFGRGVISNITSTGELEYSLDYVRSELGYKDIILERFIEGDDYRLYVVGDQVVGAIQRIPPNIEGDGINTIESLIAIKNEERSLNPRLISCPIKLDKEVNDFIGRMGYTAETILEKGKRIFLSDKSNVSLGGDPIDRLDELSDAIKETAVGAMQAIPGLEHGAVDLIVHTDDSGAEKGYVIELNPTAQIGGILFPYKGKSRDVPKAIIDYYFPETKDIHVEREKIYFDFYDVLEPLESRQGSVSTVTPAPLGKIYMKKYTVFGDVQDIGYHRGLRKQAFERGLHGHVMNLESGEMEAVVAGTDPEMVDDFRNGLLEDEERSHVIDIQEEEYNKSVKVGFETKANIKTIEEEIKLLKEEMDQTIIAMKKAEVKRRKLEKSLSWKISSPIRVIGAIFKKFK